jgi:hypothetical protein
MPEPPPQPDQGRVVGLINAAKGLTFANIVILALLVAILVPVYIVWRALSDETLLNRLLSHYQVVPSDTPCTVRVVAERGGPEYWSVSTGFAFQGADRWTVGVILDRQPTTEQIASYCASLTLIVDKMHEPDGADSEP